jgi:TonB family protein
VVSKRARVILVVVCMLGTLLDARSRAEDEKHRTRTKDGDEQVYDIGGDVQPPKLIHVVEPEFNPKSEEAFVSGAIKMQIVVTKEGSVKNPKILAGPNERQDKAAIDAVMKWRFKPALKKGEPVNVRATVEVNFHLL